MEKMTILLTNYMETTSPGGINKTVREIAKHLSKRGHKVIVLQPNPLNLSEEEIYEGFKIIRVKSILEDHFYGFNFTIWSYLKKHFKDFDPNIVHVHGYHTLFSPEIILIVRKLRPNTKIVFSPHLDTFRSTFAGKYLWLFYNHLVGKEIFNLVNEVISPSKFEAKNIQKIFKIKKDKISIIPHGVDILDIKKSKIDTTIDLLYAGYLIKRKGIPHLLRSLDILVNQMKVQNVKLTIIGEGSERDAFINLARKLNVSNYISWKRFVPQEDLIREIKKADILLLLSESEAYGIIVAESLALGTPTIITKKTALREFLNEPGCFGVDYPPDPKEVAELILRIVSENIKVGPFSERIRTWNKVAEDYERIYRKVLAT